MANSDDELFYSERVSGCRISDKYKMPIVANRLAQIFPGLRITITVNRNTDMMVYKRCSERKELVTVVLQHNPMDDKPKLGEITHHGVICEVKKVETAVMNRLYNEELYGYEVVKVDDIRYGFDNTTLYGRVMPMPETYPEKDDPEFQMVVREAVRYAKKFQLATAHDLDVFESLRGLEGQYFSACAYMCGILQMEARLKEQLLMETNVLQRAYLLIKCLKTSMDRISVMKKVEQLTKEEMDENQHRYYLQQQIIQCERELGNTEEAEIEKMRILAEKKKMPEVFYEAFEKEVKRLERIPNMTPEYNTQFNYLQTILDMPFTSDITTDNFNMKTAERCLDKNHYGMTKVKDRILEQIAVMRLQKDKKMPIICLYGPPGVGKTSLCRSIAVALGRSYVRAALGGVHDEAEIRGHRRTYIGAMPGRIIKGMIKAKTMNPVFVLDEIDKIGQMSHNGDPASALLEVLDPEQNMAFHDNYIDIDYDLSKVLFIATANDLSTLAPALLDRMELIEVSGYVVEEKIEIARKHLIPTALNALSLSGEQEVKFTKPAVRYIIEHYTRESGVRTLQKRIDSLCRKLARHYVTNGEMLTHKVDAKDVRAILGVEEFNQQQYQGNDVAGVVTGLAWTAVGGEILFVETSISQSNGSKLTLTGNLGNVMKESATIAVEYVKAHAADFNIDAHIFDHWAIHIHVPEGATPKDGPSAGVTLVTSVVSALTQRKVKSHLAMTGEITLRGKVLPVGGIKEKILAAKRAGIKEIVISKENKRNIEDIDAQYLNGLTFHYVDTIHDVLLLALTEEKVANALTFDIPVKTDKTTVEA